MLSPSEAARCGLLVQYAMDMYVANPGLLAPPDDPRLAPDWEIIGSLIGQDAIVHDNRLGGGVKVNFGYLASSKADPHGYVAVIRGTANILEWIEDAEFMPMRHPVAGRVESGFFLLFESFRFVPRGGSPVDAASGIAAAIGDAGRVTVIGHSLGSPLATYLAFDLAGLIGPDRVEGCFLASPRAGDVAFGQAFAQRVPSYRVFNYVIDVVPHLPRGQDYADLPGVTWLLPGGVQARIRFDLGCHHHVLCYAAMLDYTLADWAHFALSDLALTACIKGPLTFGGHPSP